MPKLETRLTRTFNLQYPILSAPMAFAAGGRLAAAVSRKGGLGIIGGGYGDPAWLEEQFALAQGVPVGVGFITWSLRKSPSMLTDVLKHRPVAVMLSFGDPRPFVDEIRAAGARIICQCQNMGHIMDAADIGADVIVAQGSEAGGHGAVRGTMTLVPEAADYIRATAPDSILVAAGGIADGRGLAAALMLGAEGVLMGTRFWASSDSLVHDGHRAALLEADGDGTIRTQVADIARQIAWPIEFTARIRQNAFTRRWHGHEDALRKEAATVGPIYRKGFAEGDAEQTGVFFGEAAGLIHSIESVDTLIEQINQQALDCLAGPATRLTSDRP
ncbi:NAD(P)H-dependent flavin oxidoreductase [Castellaniella sp.]|uniref:NAD(P)H-dependent flavin oxidoreductase n=1 Tax=Castellaniella sp. TaxID=1955812 RepID=UPI00355EB27F